MDKRTALNQIGEVQKQAYVDYNTRWGTYYVQPHKNGKTHYEFSTGEMKLQEEDLPFDDDHIARILNDDSNIIWEA